VVNYDHLVHGLMPPSRDLNGFALVRQPGVSLIPGTLGLNIISDKGHLFTRYEVNNYQKTATYDIVVDQ